MCKRTISFTKCIKNTLSISLLRHINKLCSASRRRSPWRTLSYSSDRAYRHCVVVAVVAAADGGECGLASLTSSMASARGPSYHRKASDRIFFLLLNCRWKNRLWKGFKKIYERPFNRRKFPYNIRTEQGQDWS